jgi:hypothetical protein
MLLLTSIVSWAGWPERTGAAVINTHRLSGWRTVNVNDTAGYFSVRDGHQRGDFRYMQIDSTVSAVRAASDIAPSMIFNDFLVYPENDATQTPVTRYFNTNDIVWAYLDPASIGRSFMYVLENGVKLTKYLVDSSLKDIVNEATTGSTSNL